MTDSDRRCVPPCERILYDFDKHEFCFECLGADHAAQGLEGECELCDVFEFRVLRARLTFFKRDRATSSSSWGSRFELDKAREKDPSASPVHSPNRDVLASASGARLGTSSEPAEDKASLVSAGFREARRHEEAFVKYLPRRAQASGVSANLSGSVPQSRPGTQSRVGPVYMRREVLRESVASRAPPRRGRGAAHRAPQAASGAYRQKLKERQEELEKEKRGADLEAALDVKNQKVLSGFYRHLFIETVREEAVPDCGAKKEEKAIGSAATEKSQTPEPPPKRSEGRAESHSDEDQGDNTTELTKTTNSNHSNRHYRQKSPSDSEDEQERERKEARERSHKERDRGRDKERERVRERDREYNKGRDRDERRCEKDRDGQRERHIDAKQDVVMLGSENYLIYSNMT
ncbi:Nuclear speckle splicing regulatory protein 1 [Triplophysa tibetana]|uniref:Nuclear speckle splicing regulatory protein 1 n=1 Tax=Triplophysa tibetana TaxID=1572043 RepID=A0A5A9NZ93_9TELE|nr:Nuclear speckle splicing regulatory protein 1 [Triplophysa tibetana]